MLLLLGGKYVKTFSKSLKQNICKYFYVNRISENQDIKNDLKMPLLLKSCQVNKSCLK